MLAITRALEKNSEVKALLKAIDAGGCPAVFSGLSGVHRAHLGAAVEHVVGRPVVFICSDEGEATRLAADLYAFSEKPAAILSAREFTFYDAATVSREWEHRRLKTLHAMAEGSVSFVAATVDGLLQKTLPKRALLSASIRLRQGESHNLVSLTEQLVRMGYESCGQVEGPGQFALRGGILDFFSPGETLPVRAEFFGDEIDSMGHFDPDTQRRTENCRDALLLPAAETLPGLYREGKNEFLQKLSSIKDQIQKRKGDFTALLSTLTRDLELLEQKASFPSADRYLGLIYGENACGADYIPQDAIVFYTESGRTAERAKGYLWQLTQDMESLVENGLLAGEIADFAVSYDEFHDRLQNYPVVFADSFAVSRYPLPPRCMFSLSCKQLPSYGGSLETAAADLKSYLEADFAVVVLCPTERRVQSLHALLREKKLKAAVDFKLHELPAPGKATIAVGSLSGGMEYPEQKLAILTEGQISGTVPRKKAAKTVTNRQKLGSYADLSPGDLVVHTYHGIGRFLEMAKLPVDGVEKDYIKLAYAGSDCLYIPATQLDLVSKYIGGGEETPARLSKLGGTEWAKAKSRAKSAAKDLAKGLIKLYAERQRQPGFAFSPDSPWQLEFEESFEYQETSDQLRCIAEIKEDMERSIPMDRLLCGDVGYGKTEVALRAVMKCVLDGRQAAILVPTTVLAQQHYTSMLARFRNFPIKIDVLSRFRTPTQMKSTIAAVKTGDVDVLVGTHRLLQKDLTFHDLGLLVVDEEQRFGVSHKERLKELSRQVDVLTLTATPIPRTLNMALSGLRDMSTIEEPPADRQPVQTYVLEHSWSVLADAIRRELSRGGQVYYLHNRVETIDRVAAHIDGMFPEATVATAHGQMTSDALDQVMSRMSEGAVQILVCTTIIETGLDIPNVNTLIIEDADKLGLAQLHQIRGRVGRSHRRAYAYMAYRQGKILTEVATKRLSAIREFAAFGSGFKIAMRDLEIRGAGNLLGPEQSGYMMSVGYDMYLKLLEEAVMEEQGLQPTQKAECAADLIVSANIPDGYVPSPEQRMDLYRRIACIRSEGEADDLFDELMDRYGDPPESVVALISVALLRVDAAAAGISEVNQKGMSLNFFLLKPDLQRVSAICALPRYRGRLLFSAGDRPYLSLRVRKGEDVLKLAKNLAEDYGKI